MRRSMVAVCASVVMIAGVALAQDISSNRTSTTGTSTTTIDTGIVTAAMMGAVENEPYQAEKTSRSVQKLTDGTVITVETHGLVARGSSGVMREDMHSNVSTMVNGSMVDRNTTMAMVADPSTSIISMWQTGDVKSKLKMAMTMQMPNMAALKAKNPVPDGGGIACANCGTMKSALSAAPPATPKPTKDADDNPNKVTHEDLGKQSIEGLLVTGKRTTTVIPVGKIGNDRPITVTDEVWTAPELGIVVKQIDSDPRTGDRTMELTGISKTEPDTALFHPPADYKVRDMSQMLKHLGDMGKTAPDAVK